MYKANKTFFWFAEKAYKSIKSQNLQGYKITNGLSKYGILLPKLLWPTVRKNRSSNQEKVLKFEAKGQEFAKILRSLEQFVHTIKGQNNFW